ncbi:transcription factor vhr1 [Saccharomyces pastorianus]|uniref:Transcription factor vhr1 n=1 Tax=Saccharomyces pastorianus TaxID=27292 RepID=A0A6C1E9V0_SACPS|nr:transcription factor vhr1 [Saccharomyces pastorianus]
MNGPPTFTQYRINKSSGNGATHKIRELLNFNDEKKWKLFSSRRLELIDKFQLSQYKASEQDQNIKQIATILRTEFGYPVSCSKEFEKLVTAAVQSVRRNRKRSKKRYALSIANGNGGNGNISSSNSTSDDEISPSIYHHTNSEFLPSSNQTTDFQYPGKFQPLMSHQNNSGRILPNVYPQMDPSSPVTSTQQKYNDIVTMLVHDLVTNAVPLSEQALKDPYIGPNLSHFAMSSLSQQPNVADSIPIDSTVPFFLREKLLLQIQRSRTCQDISQAAGSIDLYANLEILDEMSIRMSIAFVIERFFSNLVSSSMKYITSKTCSPENLALLSQRLFGSATRHNLSHFPAAQVQLRLLYLVIGGIVKDFGFDPTLYPLSEIIHHIVMVQYPLANSCATAPPPSSSNKRVKRSPPTVPSDIMMNNNTLSNRATLLTTLPMKPQSANKDVNRRVIIRFNDREQAFTFHQLSNGPPTVSEILENCKNLFNIINKNKNFGIFHNDNLLNDETLARLFDSFSTNEIGLEIRDISSIPLQDNSMPLPIQLPKMACLGENPPIPLVSPENDDPKKSSLTAFDNIINRISKSPLNEDNPIPTANISITATANNNNNHNEPVPVPSVTKNKNSFQNGNLPQPVFQPLL